MGGKSFPTYTNDIMHLCGRRVVFLCFYLVLVDLWFFFFFFGAILLESVVGKRVYDTLHEAVVIMW